MQALVNLKTGKKIYVNLNKISIKLYSKVTSDFENYLVEYNELDSEQHKLCKFYSKYILVNNIISNTIVLKKLIHKDTIWCFNIDYIIRLLLNKNFTDIRSLNLFYKKLKSYDENLAIYSEQHQNICLISIFNYILE